MAVGLAAVTAHDARGPVALSPDRGVTAGEVVLEDGRSASFSIAQKPPDRRPDFPDLRVQLAGHDLVPEDTPIVLGHLPWASVTVLRTKARIYRPFPAGAPRPSGAEVPLVAILPKAEEGDATAGKVADLDPYGVGAVTTDDGQEVFVLAGGHDSQVLVQLPVDSPSVKDFRRRLRATKGLHVVMVADEATRRGEGTVCGFFECHQPPPKSPPGANRPSGGKPRGGKTSGRKPSGRKPSGRKSSGGKGAKLGG